MTYHSKTVYSGDNTTVLFAVSFPYIKPAHIFLEVAGASVPFTFDSPTMIRADTAPVTGVNNVVVRRVTPNVLPLHTIQSGTINPPDINENDLQLLYIMQELEDAQGDLSLAVEDAQEAAANAEFWANSVLNPAVPTFATVAALRLGAVSYAIAKLGGYDSAGDGCDSWITTAGDQSASDDAGFIFVDAGGNRWYRTGVDLSKGYPITFWGVKPTGSAATNTTRMAAALATGRPLYVPPGDYPLSLGTLTLPVNAKINGAGKYTARFTNATQKLTSDGSADQCFFYAIGGSGVRIQNIGFEGYDDVTIAVGIFGQNSEDWRLEDIHVTNCRLNYTYCPGNGGGTDYANTTDGNMGRNIHFARCTGINDSVAHNSLGALAIFFTRDWSITDCSFDTYYHGIQWWGGNADSEGAVANTRKCYNGTIINCHVKNLSQGGIWGSMSRAVKIYGCSARVGGDVGLDAEGSQEITFEACTSKDFTNGALATFYKCRNILFLNCDVELDACTLAFRSYNSSLDASLNESVTIQGGSMIHLSGTGIVDNASGPTRLFKMSGVNLRDVTINMTYQNGHCAIVDNCEMLFTRDIPAAYGSGAIAIGNFIAIGGVESRGEIRDTTVRSLVSQTNTTRAIAVVGDDVNVNDNCYKVSGCTTSGFTTDILAVDNSGRARYFFQNNLLKSGTINVSGLNGSSTVSKANNYGFDNTSL